MAVVARVSSRSALDAQGFNPTLISSSVYSSFNSLFHLPMIHFAVFRSPLYLVHLIYDFSQLECCVPPWQNEILVDCQVDRSFSETGPLA